MEDIQPFRRFDPGWIVVRSRMRRVRGAGCRSYRYMERRFRESLPADHLLPSRSLPVQSPSSFLHSPSLRPSRLSAHTLFTTPFRTATIQHICIHPTAHLVNFTASLHLRTTCSASPRSSRSPSSSPSQRERRPKRRSSTVRTRSTSPVTRTCMITMSAIRRSLQ